MSEASKILEVKDLTVRYGEKTVLKSLEMSVMEGRISGLVGPNGAGKTTLLDTLYGLTAAEKGVMHWSGRVLARADIGYLEAENYFYPTITGREYLELFRLQNKGFDIDGWSEVFDIPLDEMIDVYSLGTKKKLALLGVLSLNRPILMLDEPFNHLDLESNHLLQSILRKLATSGKMVLLTSHILASLTELCDDILFLMDGNVGASFAKSEFGRIKDWLESVGHKDRVERANTLLGNGSDER